MERKYAPLKGHGCVAITLGKPTRLANGEEAWPWTTHLLLDAAEGVRVERRLRKIFDSVTSKAADAEREGTK